MRDSSEIKKTLAEKLTQARKNAGLSQAQVAKLIDLNRPAISEIESAKRNVTAGELIKFSEIYSVSSSWLTSQENTDNKVRLAARELSKLDNEDLDKILNVLASLRKSEAPKNDK